jgi:hypothetical protein
VTQRRRSIVLALVAASVGWHAATAEAQTVKPAALPREEARARNMNAYVELLRSDLRTQKVAVLTEMMQFTEDEDKAFWPIYREYDLALSRLNDERLALIESYAKAYDTLTAATASDLVVKALDLESRRTALKQQYFAKLKGAVSPLVAAKALQIEQQILLLVDLQIAASLPVVQ